MKFFQKPIFTGFMPNLTSHDVRLSLSFLLPWKWTHLQRGEASTQVEEVLKKYYKSASATTFDSGRSALFFALQALSAQSGDEVLVQAYTCGVVSNAIIWTGAKPVYVDIKNDFTMDPVDLEKKITPKAKILIVQHTFGIPADITQLLAIAHKYNLRVIEDCAHVIGGTVEGTLLGTRGDIGMLSFGADKSLSCGRGGALITNNLQLAQKIVSLQAPLSFPSHGVIMKQLITFVIFFICKPLYNLGIGKFLLAFFKSTHILSRIIEPEEKQGNQVALYPAKLPNALAEILLYQLNQLTKFNAHRVEIATKYSELLQNISSVNIPLVSTDQIYYLRFPLLVENPKLVHAKAKQEGILLGDWYSTAIAPQDMNKKSTQYQIGSCPNAEKLAAHSINLPTHFQITTEDVNRISRIFTIV